jgi:hypothetical protein
MRVDLSIIIVSWNTRELLRACLASLPGATAGLVTEMIVVDNASGDGSAAMVRADFPACRLLEGGGNLGFARGNNLAFPHCAGRAVLLLNPDTVCPPGSLAALFGFLMATPDAAAAGPTLVDAEGRPTVTWGDFPAARLHLFALFDPQRHWLPGRLRRTGLGVVPALDDRGGPVDYVTGACLMLRREALAQVGPLDERFFMYFEETDWCRRARAAGWRVYYCAAARVIHLEGRAAERTGRFRLEQFQHSYRLFVAKHAGPRAVFRFRAAQFVEYSAKALWRCVAPGERARNRALARLWWATARLQWRARLAPRPPGGV